MNTKTLTTATLLLLLGTAVASLWAADKGPSGLLPQVSQAARHDTSPPLRAMRVKPSTPGVDRPIPLRVPLGLADRHKPTEVGEDPVRQAALAPSPSAAAAPPPILSFEGLSDDDNRAVLGFRVVPPDTEGDVGRSHYVQWINLVFAVYDKATGTRIFGPVPGNLPWSGFGGICETNNDGDPIVLYDHLADRWVFSQFAIGADGHQCI
ncbi:MAG: hypothetical protein ACE5HB_06425, partial [Terriglobia bacterium]